MIYVYKGQKKKMHIRSGGQNTSQSTRKGKKAGNKVDEKMKKSKSSPLELAHANDEDEERERDSYNSLSIQVIYREL